MSPANHGDADLPPPLVEIITHSSFAIGVLEYEEVLGNTDLLDLD
jgi:hypothetical protein